MRAVAGPERAEEPTPMAVQDPTAAGVERLFLGGSGILGVTKHPRRMTLTTRGTNAGRRRGAETLTTDHPTPEILARLLDGKLSNEESRWAVGHLVGRCE